MQPFKTLLVALMLGGSAAALAADNSQSSTVETTREQAPLYAQGWPAIREVESAWPQWMRTLTGTVLALHEEGPRVGMCSAPYCAQLPRLTRDTGVYQQAAQQPSGSTQVRHTSVQWRAAPEVRLPQRWSL